MQTPEQKPTPEAPASAAPGDATSSEEHHEKLHPIDDFLQKIRHSLKKMPLLEKIDDMFYNSVKVAAGLGIQNILKFTVDGKENIPVVGKAILLTIADNPIADMAVIIQLSGRQIHFMMSPKLFKTPGLHTVLDSLGMYRSTKDKDDQEPVERTMHYLNVEGALVAMTPEEKLEPDVQVKTVASILKFAIAAKAPIVPIALHGTKSLGWKKSLKVKCPAPIEIPSQLQREKKRDERYAKAKEIVDLIHEMKTELSVPQGTV